MRLLKILEGLLKESKSIFFPRKYNKLVVKYSNKPANIKLLKQLEQMLKQDGNIQGHGLHGIRQPIKSEYDGKMHNGWKVVYVSKSDDLRLAYLKHKDGTIEVKFGKASDIGYSH